MPGRLSGIGWVYLFGGLGLTMVSITVFGNILTSFSAEGSADKYTLGNYVDLFSQDTLFSVTARTAMLGSPALTSGDVAHAGLRGETSVSGPGQNCPISASTRASSQTASSRTCSGVASTGSAFSPARPLAS